MITTIFDPVLKADQSSIGYRIRQPVQELGLDQQLGEGKWVILLYWLIKNRIQRTIHDNPQYWYIHIVSYIHIYICMYTLYIYICIIYVDVYIYIYYISICIIYVDIYIYICIIYIYI